MIFLTRIKQLDAVGSWVLGVRAEFAPADPPRIFDTFNGTTRR
jgi:hypothetical protein